MGDADTLGMSGDEVGYLTELERNRQDLQTLWDALETCECPEWAVPHRAAEDALARVARRTLGADERDRNGAEDGVGGTFSDADGGL